MSLFGNKKPPATPAAAATPVVSVGDLAEAAQLMDRWDQSLGDSSAVNSCLDAIGRRGGFVSIEHTMSEAHRLGDGGVDVVVQRIWRWWLEAARAARDAGDDALAGRIFMCVHLIVIQMLPNFTPADFMENGLQQPKDEYYEGLAAVAVDALGRLPADFLIHDTATGKVPVVGALQMATEIVSR